MDFPKSEKDANDLERLFDSMRLPETRDLILVVDFGSQYTQLIARRIRECQVYSEITSCFTPFETIMRKKPVGIILSGGPSSVYHKEVLRERRFVELKIPILGICYGMQLVTYLLGGRVRRAARHEYGKKTLKIIRSSRLFEGVDRKTAVWMSHGDEVTRPPIGARILARTDNSAIAAFELDNIFCLQFHPEVYHTQQGMLILKNFLLKICKADANWTMENFVRQKVSEIRQTVGPERVACALSGGVDSAVTAVLVHKAVGKRLVAFFVDNGLLRNGEVEEVVRMFRHRLNLRLVKAPARFFNALKGVIEPEAKRKIIGREFIRVFERAAAMSRKIKYLAQGTLYPDVIESGKGIGPAGVIKSHHNVGGLPEKMGLTLIEPLRELFKDEVRILAEKLNLPEKISLRKPFPGPGLAVRIVGEITEERLGRLRRADAILQEESIKLKNYQDIWQIFAVLLPVKTVGVMGDGRTYQSVCVIRAVTSEDGMTADWARLPYELLERVSSRITNEVKGINRVVFDITSKPPGTIEWE